jgi:hypothetical protein
MITNRTPASTRRRSAGGLTGYAQLAITIFVVLIVAIVVLGGVAIFCIAKGKSLVWAQKGWTHWRIACD